MMPPPIAATVILSGRRFLSLAAYDLPFFKNRVFGGWQIASIGQLRSGVPFSVGFTPTQAGWYASRADVVSSDVYPANQNIENWFNPAAFATPAPFTLDRHPRCPVFRSPARLRENISVLKDAKIGDRFTVQVRAEAFNA